MTRRDFVKPAFSLRKETLRENTCTIASGDYSTPVSQRRQTYIPDFICYDSIIVELKALSDTTPAHKALVLNYLKATGMRLGLLINFDCYPKATAERIIL
ncbi:MAG: hypothetical protein RIQ94_3450 [Pseudomonadota bacterium]